MILVSGIIADAVLELVCARLESMHADYVLIDHLRYPRECGVSYTLESDRIVGFIHTQKGDVSLDELTGAYARYVDYSTGTPAAGWSAQEEVAARAEGQQALMVLLDLLACRVVNRPRASISNDSKLFQRRLVELAGFRAPRTLVTTSPEDALAFREQCGGAVIFKSMSSVRSIVRRLADADLSRLALLRNCPTQFQEYVPGADVRVHVVGERLFATRIATEASDYRYAGHLGKRLEAAPFELSTDVSAACVALTRNCGLEVAGIDLRFPDDGPPVCFEVNPSPAFLYFERLCGQPISEAIAQHLLRS